MLSKVTDYLKNVGKSVVYATSDVLEKDNEFIYNFANTNKEVFTAAYSSVRNYRTTINKIETNFKQSKVYQAADIGIKALFEDLKTGKFYNKARAEEIAATMGGFDMSDDFDIEEFEKGLANRDIAEGDKAVIEAVEKSTRLSGELVSDTIARSASAVISNQKASDRIFFTQNVQMISGIKAVAETTSLVGKTINNTNQMLKTMADNQKTYYERTGKAVDEMHAMMREFLDMQRNLYNAQRKAEQNASGKKKQSYSDIVDYRGVLNLQEYAKNVKSNINRKISESPAGMLFNGGFGEDANMFAQFVSSPLEFIPKWFVRHLIPEATKNASKSLNDTLSGLVSTTIAKLNNMAEKDDSPFAKLFGEIFGVKIRKKTRVEVGKYNKGPVPFDGITRKAIVDVIPGYLRRIEAIISGNKERVFDYSSGKWTGMEDATKKLDTMYMDHIKSTMNEFVGEIEATLKNVRGATREEDERLIRARNAIYKDIYEHNGDWTRYTKKGRDYTSQLAREISSGDTTVDVNDIKMIAKAIKEIQRKNNGTDWKKIATKLSNQALGGRETYTRRMDELERNMDSSAFMTALEDMFSNAHINSKTGMPLYISPDKNKKVTEQAFQNTLGAAILKIKDEYKHDIFYYLRSLEDNATWVREYLSTNKIGGGGGKKKNNNGGNPNVPDFNAIAALRGNATNLDPDALYREAQRKLDEDYTRARRSDFDSGRAFAYSRYGENAFGGAAMYMERTTDKAIEQARIDKANSQEENLFWSIFHDTSKAKRDYDSKKFLEQLRDAHDIGEKYEVIKHGVEKLAAAPMKMLEHVIRKADESVYHFMFGRADDEVDEDGNPIQGLLAKTIHEMKQTFKKLNEWLNEKLLDPLKKKLDEWGIHSVTDALDKITGGRFSDAKNAIADTVLGTKGEDGRRTGGWADPFRKAFSYNFGEIYDRRAAEARRKKERDRARQEALAEMQAEDDFNSIYHAEGTAGRAKSDLFTMLSPGEELISPSGRSRTVTEGESYSPHIVPKGTTIYNPQPRNVRKQQKAIEQQKAVAWAKNMKFNANADETGGLYDFEKKIFNNEKAKAQFQEQYEYLDMYLEEKASELIASGTDEGIALGQEYLVLYEEFNRYKSNYAGIMNPDPKGYGSNYAIYAKFVKWIKNAYKALTTNSLKEAFYVEDQKAKQTKANVQNKTESEPEKIKNKWLHEQLDKLKYDEAKPENIARVNKIADTTAKTAIGTGAGLLLGNPLLGLVGGAVAGIVKNNKAINEFIFGDIEHDNGLISKKTQQYLKDAIPTVRKTSLIGGIAGLVTGLGPIPGILMGSAAGFAAKNEDLMETLFGPKEEREKRMEKIKKAAPRMGIGAAAGALLGPFGLLGGAALGAAGGLFTTTNTFKELLYGEIDEDGNPVKDEDGKLKGGILGALQVSFVDPLKDFANDMKTKAKDFIRDKIVDPIAGAIKPITAGMKHIVKDVLTAVPNALNWVFEKSFGIPMGDFLRDKVFGPIARFTKGFLKLPFTIFKGILSAPGKIIGGIGNAIRGSQIRRGTADYMTAEERLAYREQHKTQFRGNWIGKILHPFRRDRMLAEDQALAETHVGDIKNENGEVTSYGVDTIIQGVEELTTSERDAGKAVRTAQRQLNNIVDKHFRNRGLISLRNDKDKILKALNNGKLDQAMKLIEKLKTKDGKKLSGEELQNFQDDVTKAYNVLEEAKALRKSVGSRRGRDRSSGLAKYEKMLKDQGFKNVNLKSDRQRSRILALLKQEKSSKAGAYADTLSEDDRISAEATVGAINSQTTDLLKALTGIKESIDLINTNYDGAKDTSKGAAGVNKIFEDLQGTDENGEPVMKTEFGKSFTRGMSNSIHKDVVNSARRRYNVNQRRHQRKRKDDNLVFERITKVKDLGINTQPNSYWSSNDDRARKIFNLLDNNSKFDINTALKHAFNTKNFIKNFSTAMSTSKGVFVEADFIDRIASIKNNKTEQECLSKAVAAGIDLTNKTIFSLDYLNALLGASEKQIQYNTIKEVFKQIQDYIKAYNVAPTPAEIQTWFANLSQLRSDAKYTKQKLKEQAEQEAEQDNSTPPTSPNPVFSNADTDEGTEAIPVEHVGWLKDKWREKIKPGLKGFKSDIGSSFDDLKDIRNTKKTKNLKYELLVVKGIKAIIDRTTRVAEATENQDEREEEKTKEEKKLAKKKAKADKKANNGNLWQRANARVEEFGENVKNKGDNFLRALSHPIKMVKGAIHGSKEEYESKQDGDKFSIIDILHGIKKGQEKELEVLKDQEDKGERKEPIWKRVLKAIFGKSLASIAFRTFALPLGVGLFKNQVWPLIKEKAWPWIQNKLFGDPDRDDDGFFGRLKYWFKDHVVPVLFGEKNEEGVWTKGWFSGAANFWEQKAKPFLVGEDGNSGLIGKIKEIVHGIGYVITDGFNLAKSWLLNENFSPSDNNPLKDKFGAHTFKNEDQGSSGFIKTLLYNWADGLTTIVPFATKIIVKALPKLFVGLLTGVVEGVKSLFGIGDVEKKMNERLDNNVTNAYINSMSKQMKVNDSGKTEKLLSIDADDVDISGGGSSSSSSSSISSSDNIIKTSSGDDYVNESYNEEVSNGANAQISLAKYGSDRVVSKEEYNKKYSWIENVDEMTLDEAIKYAEDNLVILPYSMFNDEDSYRAHFEGIFGPGTIDRYGWDTIKAIQDPIVVDMSSEVYRMIQSERKNEQAFVSETTFRYLLNCARGGVVGCKVVPKLLKVTTKTAAILAKGGKALQKIAPWYVKPFVALGNLPAKAVSKSGTFIQGVSNGIKYGYDRINDAKELVKVSGGTAKEIKQAGKTAGKILEADVKAGTVTADVVETAVKAADKLDDAAKVADKLSKCPAWVQQIAKRAEQFFSAMADTKIVKMISNATGKATQKISKVLTSAKAKTLGTKFGLWLFEKFPNFATKMTKVLTSETVKKAAWVITILSVETDIIFGAADVNEVLGVTGDYNFTSWHYMMAALINTFNNEVLFGIPDVHDIGPWLTENLFVELFDDQDLKNAIEGTNKRYEAWKNDHPEDADLSRKDWLSAYYPSGTTLYNRDLQEGNWKNVSDNFKAGWGITGDNKDNPVGAFFADVADHWATGMSTISNWWNGLWGQGKDKLNPFELKVPKLIMPSKVLHSDIPDELIDNTKVGFGAGKHVDQRMSNMRYNAPGDTEYQTVADSGCGPAAAVSVLNQYGKGKLEEAAKYSLANGYKEPNGGTYPGFFKDYLGQNGIDTQYESDPNKIMGNLAQGKPVILMGTGNGNNRTPYDGANGSHYVTATGIDRSGNMIIEDPDDRRGALKYNARNVLDRTSIAISTNPSGRSRSLISNSYGKARLPKSYLNKMPKLKFGRGVHTLKDLAKDALQDLRIWKDPGSNKSEYISNIGTRIMQAARYQTQGIFYNHYMWVATAAVNAGIKTGMDPAILIAIAIMESGHGTSDVCKDKLNFWGWNFTDKTGYAEGATDFKTNGSNAITLQSLENAFLAYANAISKGYYDAGQKCLYQFYDNGGNHQYSGEINDITTDWVVDVSKYMAAIHNCVGQTEDNLSWHDPSGKVVLLKDATNAWTKTKDGFNGKIYPATISNDLMVTTNYKGESSDGTSKSSSKTSTIFTAIADYGKKVLRSVFGDFYDLVFGSPDTDTENTYQNTFQTGHYNENGYWVDNNLDAENATDWFTRTLNSTVSLPYARNAEPVRLSDEKPHYVHHGIDFAAAAGTPIISPIDGEVTYRNDDESKDYGNNIIVTDAYDSNLTHRFGHMLHASPLSMHSKVKRGETIIGYVGSTGLSTGNHLHYEIDDIRMPNAHIDAGYGSLKDSIDPDLQYDWSRYLKTIDPYTGQDVSKMGSDELRDMVYAEQERFIQNKYDKILDPIGREEALAKYNSIENDSVVRKRLRDEIINIEKSGGINSQNSSYFSNIKNTALQLDLSEYMNRHGYQSAINSSDVSNDYSETTDQIEFDDSEKVKDVENDTKSIGADLELPTKLENNNLNLPTLKGNKMGFGRGKSRSISNQFKMLSEINKMKYAASKSDSSDISQSLANKVKDYIKIFNTDPFATEGVDTRYGKGRDISSEQSHTISRTLGTAKNIKKPKPLTRPTTPTNYGKAKLPTLSTTKTYVNNATTTTNANSNDIAMINYSKLIITIIELLTSINDNSNKVDKIIDLLRKYGPSFGIDTSGYGKAKTGAEKKAAARHSIVRNHVMDPSWGFAAMDNMNRNDVANKFMEEVQALARE